MQLVKIKDLFGSPKSYEGLRITVRGWVRTVRDMKAFGFLALNDGSCFKSVQIVLEEGSVSNFKDVVRQNVGASLVVTGAFKLTEGAKQPFEISAEDISIEG